MTLLMFEQLIELFLIPILNLFRSTFFLQLVLIDEMLSFHDRI